MKHGINAARFGAAALLTCFALGANADAITDWNLKASGFVTDAKLGTPPVDAGVTMGKQIGELTAEKFASH